MRGIRRKKGLVALALAACVAATACDTAWNDMTPWSYGPPCDHPTYYAIHNGDFTPDEVADIHAAVHEVSVWSAVDTRFAGFVDWRNGSPAQPADTVSIERRDIIADAPFVSYGNPNVVKGVYTRGVLFIGTAMHLPTRVPPGYNTGQTFYGLVAHEASHAFVGIGDMYNRDDGHPGLLMGNGRTTMSNFAAGDLIGLINKGCRTPQDKAERTESLRRTYG